jgi:hypothetical protein
MGSTFTQFAGTGTRARTAAPLSVVMMVETRPDRRSNGV